MVFRGVTELSSGFFINSNNKRPLTKFFIGLDDNQVFVKYWRSAGAQSDSPDFAPNELSGEFAFHIVSMRPSVPEVGVRRSLPSVAGVAAAKELLR